MPTVTSENKAEFDREFMRKKGLIREEKPTAEHQAAQLPEMLGSEIVESHRERTYPHATQRWNELRRELQNKEKGWKSLPNIFYDEQGISPPKDVTKWKHAVTPLEHEQHGKKYVVLSQEKRGYTIHHLSKKHDE